MRGRGHGRGCNGAGCGHGHGRNIYLGSYSPDQWRSLSAKDKQRVYDGRRKLAEQRQVQTQHSGHGSGCGINVATITAGDISDVDLQSNVTMPMNPFLCCDF